MRGAGWLIGLLFVLPAGSAQDFCDWPTEPLPQPLRQATPSDAHYQALRLFVQGQLLARRKQPVEAASVLEKALALQPSAGPILKALVPLCFQLDRDQRALEYGLRALVIDPADCQLAYELGTTLRDRGYLAEALGPLRLAVQHGKSKAPPAEYAEMLFALAGVQEELKQDAAAAESYEAVAKLLDQTELILADPAAVSERQLQEEAARTYEKLGQCRLRLGQLEAAAAALARARERAPHQAARLDLTLASIQQASGNLPAALQLVERVVATMPPETSAYRRQTELLVAMGRGQEATPRLEQAVAREPYHARLRLLLAERYQAEQRLQQAEELLLATFASCPTEECYRGLANFYSAQGRWPELLQRFDEACGDPSRASLAKLQLEAIAQDRTLVQGLSQAAVARLRQQGQLSSTCRRVLTSLCRQAKLLPEAEFLCRTLLREEEDLGVVYLELCRILAESGNFAVEAEVCAEALARKTGLEPLIFRLERAKALSQCGQAEQALRLLEELMPQLQPGTPEQWQARFLRATALHRAGRLDQATAEAEALLAMEMEAGTQRAVRHLLSALAWRRGDLAAAQRHLDLLLEADPDEPTVLADLALVWAETGKNLEEAERLARRAITLERGTRQRARHPLDPPGLALDSARLLDALAWVLHQRGRHAEAARLLEQAARLPDGEDPRLHEHLGDIYLKLNEPAKAEAAWRKAVQIYLLPEYLGHRDRQRQVADKLRGLGVQAVQGSP